MGMDGLRVKRGGRIGQSDGEGGSMMLTAACASVPQLVGSWLQAERAQQLLNQCAQFLLLQVSGSTLGHARMPARPKDTVADRHGGMQ
jgi:hypothetical protein